VGRAAIVRSRSLAPDRGLYLTPLGLVAEEAAGPLLRSGAARLLGATGLAYATVGVARRGADGTISRTVLPVAGLDGALAEALEPFGRVGADDPLAALGLPADRPLVMGIVNVTPDSFSDGGRFAGADAVAHGRALVSAGADILDIGGESTRPGSDEVATAVELGRVLPVIEGLRDAGVPLSVDTRKAAVMRAALAAGARILNDVAALGFEREARAVAAACDVPVILMHAQGEPKTMQDDPRYADVLTDVYDWFAARLDWAEAGGVARRRVVLDPGIGFGKTVEHNLALIDSLALFHGLGRPLLLGASRKGFIGRLSAGEGPDRRLGGSLAVALAGAARGARILRVHDVAETVQALRLARAVAAAGTA
jgi:dihydropteroate synthase